MKNLLFGLLIMLVAGLHLNAQSHSEFFESVDKFLKSYVVEGKVDYDAIANNTEQLTALSKQIANFDLSESSFNEQLAFYLNAYNVLVIQNVVDNSPLASPLDLKGFFDELTFEVAGERLTLNQIENEIIRPRFKDPRIHFALVCGANGCPPITDTAFTANNVDEMLASLTSMAINDPGFVKVDHSSGAIYASEIFKWYIVDFGNSAEGVVGFINSYSKDELGGYALDYYSYDWQLNTK